MHNRRKEDGLTSTGAITGDLILTFGIPSGPCKLTFAGEWDGATLSLEEQVNGIWFPLLDETTPIAYTDDNSFAYSIFGGDTIRFVVTGAGASTAINYSVTYGV